MIFEKSILNKRLACSDDNEKCTITPQQPASGGFPEVIPRCRLNLGTAA
ncbi:hypothetical protein SDC9_75548 [bioreactor metagenome]|uniref:Uncharacterized protein n=1 Tax=bioreactor metagenome TaxID=1076179 RepID=A0A644YKV0_9ZZZZ